MEKSGEEVIWLDVRESGRLRRVWFTGASGQSPEAERSTFIGEHVRRFPNRIDTTLNAVCGTGKMSRKDALAEQTEGKKEMEARQFQEEAAY